MLKYLKNSYVLTKNKLDTEVYINLCTEYGIGIPRFLTKPSDRGDILGYYVRLKNAFDECIYRGKDVEYFLQAIYTHIPNSLIYEERKEFTLCN